jgi:chromosome partitioning protein
MPVVAVVNRKGGSGKSTLATHLAGYCANAGLGVMLGDVDRQQSSLAWLRRRAEQSLPRSMPIASWAVDHKSVMRPPAGVRHVVLDTPAGLRGLELARVVMYADAILIPVCNSAFDRESAVECYAELKALPRVSSGRCKVAAVGMRLDARTRSNAQLEVWAAQHKLPYVGALREARSYVRHVEQGLTLFDLPREDVQADLAQWQPILGWLHAAWAAAERHDAQAKPAARLSPRPPAARTERFVQAPSLPSDRAPLTVLEPPQVAPRAGIADRIGRLFAAFKPPH